MTRYALTIHPDDRGLWKRIRILEIREIPEVQ